MGKVFNIYAKNTPVTGSPKYVAESLEYHDAWMGEEYVMVTLTSPTPLSLEIGDYLIYRGRKYSIYNIPSALKQARRLSHGEAFKYESVKFSAYTTELSEIRFLDIVLGDNELHYTSLPTFSVYCETLEDLVDRLQANTDRVKTQYDYWYFITPSKQRTLARIIKWDETQQEWVPDLERRAVAATLWSEYFIDGAEVNYNKTNVNISVDNASVWDGISYLKQHFGTNFISNERSVNRSIIIGAAAKHSTTLFEYGKGNGLNQIERIADSDQLVVTKLFAYGSEKNLPYHHYSDLTTRPYLKVTGDYHTSSTEHSISVLLENISTVSAFTNKVNTGTGTTYCTFTCMIGNIVCDGNAELVGISGSSTYSVRLLLFAQGSTAGNPNSKFTTQEVIDSIKAILDNAIASGIQEMVVFMSDTDITKFPDNRRYMLVDGMPNNMAVNCLMLPGFPLYALNDVVKCEYIEVEDEHDVNETRFYVRNTPDDNWPSIPSFIITGNHVFTFSTDRLRPWIKSPNSVELGIKEGDVHFDEENDDNGLQDVHPSIEGMTEDDVFHNGSNVRLDEIYSADIITDNGRFDETAIKPDFHVVIRDLGFDLKKAFTDAGSSMKLSMKDGYCGGRDFNVKTMVQLSDGKWRLTIERFHDESLELYFPYSDTAAHYETPVADEPYQIRGPHTEGGVTVSGDHFVLTDILIQDTNYVHAASVELFRKACLWLASNDYTRFTYMPKIDEIFMARNRDTAYRSEYETIKAGEMFDFADTDLGIDTSIYIDQLTIKEGGNQDIPTFDVTLREDKQVGSVQRLQNQINSIVSGTGSGVNRKTVQQMIESWVKPRFLSKVDPDTAQKLITFQQGLLSLGEALFREELHAYADASFEEKLKSLGDAIFYNNAHSDGFTSGMGTGTGWNIDKYGNAEFESARIRSFLEVVELLINRIQAQEGDTIFSDNDQIESVEKIVDQTDNSVSYILSLKEKWEGYYTSQMYGNILKGIINTMAAKDAGVSDESENNTDKQGVDDGGNLFYTSWMRVIATHNTDNTLDDNQIRVVLFGDNDVPAHKNFEPCEQMVVARMGCIDYSSNDSSEYAAEGLSTAQAIASSIKKRQTVFYLSSNEGRIVKLTGVNKPILEEGNYGMVFGVIPDFIKSWDSWQRLVREHPHLEDRDYLYAQGLIYEDLVHVDITGAPVPIDVDCGDWVKGDAQGVTPTIGHGIYFNIGWNETNRQFERHIVRHSNGRWLCLQNQPVTVSGVTTYYEPKFGSAYWKLVDGNGNYTIEFSSTNGDSFYVGHVGTTITPHLFFGNVDISSDIDVQYWSWKRQTESGETAGDIIWNNNHTQTRVLTLTNADMPTAWARNNKAIFTCTVVVNDGNSQVIIQNQVIA